MKKYLYIFKTTLIDNLQYTINLIFGFIGFVIIIYTFLNLWMYVYSDPNELINGYNLNQMIWYCIITELIYKVSASKVITNELVKDIKNGNVAYNLNKPYNYIAYIMARYLGNSFVLLLISLIIGPLLGILFVGPLDGFKFISLPFFFIVFLLGIIIGALIYLAISLLSFFMEDSHPFIWIYKKILLVLGILFPIEFFPKVLQPIIKMTPVYVVTYGPAILLINFSMKLFWKILLAQVIYLGIVILIVYFIYRKGVKKLNVNGG